jgi:hypothetical protein
MNAIIIARIFLLLHKRVQKYRAIHKLNISKKNPERKIAIPVLVT